MKFPLEITPDGKRTRVQLGESLHPVPKGGVAELTFDGVRRLAFRTDTGAPVSRFRVQIDDGGVARMVPDCGVARAP